MAMTLRLSESDEPSVGTSGASGGLLKTGSCPPGDCLSSDSSAATGGSARHSGSGH